MLEKMDAGLGKIEDAFSRFGVAMRSKAQNIRMPAAQRKGGTSETAKQSEASNTRWTQRFRFGRGRDKEQGETDRPSTLNSRVFGYDKGAAKGRLRFAVLLFSSTYMTLYVTYVMAQRLHLLGFPKRQTQKSRQRKYSHGSVRPRATYL